MVSISLSLFSLFACWNALPKLSLCRVRAIIFLTCIACQLAGCAGQDPVLRSALPQAEDSRMELTDTVFFPQKDYQCGPAALATLIVHAGKEISPDHLERKIFLPDRKGSLQVELVAASRGYDLIPYVIDPSFTALLAELRSGRPVLVLQNLGLAAFSLWHYAVVIGYDTEEDTMILRSGTVRRQMVSARRFIVSWRQSGSWAMVVLRPGEMPANPDQGRYLKAVAALEEVGRYDTALAGYQAALQRWPDNDTALLGLGNCYYGLGRLDAAEKTYHSLVNQYPGHAIGYNNLAYVLAEQRQYTQALAVLDKGLLLAEYNGGAGQMLQQARDEIVTRQVQEQTVNSSDD